MVRKPTQSPKNNVSTQLNWNLKYVAGNVIATQLRYFPAEILLFFCFAKLSNLAVQHAVS